MSHGPRREGRGGSYSWLTGTYPTAVPVKEYAEAGLHPLARQTLLSAHNLEPFLKVLGGAIVFCKVAGQMRNLKIVLPV